MICSYRYLQVSTIVPSYKCRGTQRGLHFYICLSVQLCLHLQTVQKKCKMVEKQKRRKERLAINQVLHLRTVHLGRFGCSRKSCALRMDWMNNVVYMVSCDMAHPLFPSVRSTFQRRWHSVCPNWPKVSLAIWVSRTLWFRFDDPLAKHRLAGRFIARTRSLSKNCFFSSCAHRCSLLRCKWRIPPNWLKL